MRKKICVIGGGISGLSASYFLLEKGYDVSLFESSSQLGGLASAFDFGGISIEKYYHFVCGGDTKLTEFADKLGLKEKVKFRPTKTASYYNGKYYPFSTPFDLLKFAPIPFSSRIRVGLHTSYSKILKNWEHLDNVPAKEWLIRSIGNKAYHAIWHPLLREKFGKYYDQISAAWIWHRIHRVSSSRKNILSREKMGYFEGGSLTLIDAISQKIKKMGGVVHLNQKAERIEKNARGLRFFFNSDNFYDFDCAVLAVPLPIAAEIIRDINKEFFKTLSSFRFFNVVCGIFRLRESISKAFWLNINDPRIVASGLIEYTNLNPLENIKPDKIVYIPFYLPDDDRRFSENESTLQSEFFRMLKIIKPDISESSLINFRLFKSRFAQAICTVGFKNRMPPVKTPIDRLYMLDSTQIYPSDRSLNDMITLAGTMINQYF